jgi:hypothetical protein
MFDKYLDDRNVSLALENHVQATFLKALSDSKIERQGWTIPFFKTSFPDGTPFGEGSPIFSAANDEYMVILDVMLNKYQDRMTEFTEKWDDRYDMLVIVGPVRVLPEIENRIVKWVRNLVSS